MSEPDYNDIVYRLRNPTYWFFQIVGPKSGASFNGESDAPRDAADEITRLREENARLRKALKPFADALVDYIDPKEPPWTWEHVDVLEMIKLGDLYAARAAIREGDSSNKKEDQSL